MIAPKRLQKIKSCSVSYLPKVIQGTIIRKLTLMSKKVNAVYYTKELGCCAWGCICQKCAHVNQNWTVAQLKKVHALSPCGRDGTRMRRQAGKARIMMRAMLISITFGPAIHVDFHMYHLAKNCCSSSTTLHSKGSIP